MTKRSSIKMIIFILQKLKFFFGHKSKIFYRTHFVTNCKQNVFILKIFFPENLRKFSFDSYKLNKLNTKFFCKQGVLDTT